MIPRPLEHLRAAGHLYPGAWKLFDQMRQDRGKDLPEWPDWCYCPMAGAYAVVSGGGSNRVSPHMIGDVGRLAALAAWRVTQGIYRFDPEMYEAVRTTPLSAELPCDLFYRLPEWCVYIETPGMDWNGSPQYGFFAHLEWDVEKQGREELRLVMDCEAALLPQVIHLGAWSLVEAVENANRAGFMEAREAGLRFDHVDLNGLAELIAQQLTPLVSLLLYLCQESNDYAGGERPANPIPKRTKQGWRLFPPDKPRLWDVAVRMGAALRQARAAAQSDGDGGATGDRNSPRGHVRRAHWHTYRIGAGRADSVVRWLPPIAVNLAETEERPAVVHRVIEPKTGR